MSFFQPQNPGIGGLDELTNAEEIFLTSLAGLSLTNGDILYATGGSLTNLGIGTSGQVLTVSGGFPAWSAAGSGNPGGSDTQVQYNDSGVFGGDSKFVFNETGKILGVGSLDILGSVTDFVAQPAPYVDITDNHTYDYASGVFPFFGVIMPPAVNWGGTHTLKQSANILGAGFLFWANGTIVNQVGANQNMGPFYALANQTTFTADTNTITKFISYEIVSVPVYNTINGGTYNIIGDSPAFTAGIEVGSGANLLRRIGFNVQSPTVSGTLTNHVGLLVPSVTSGATSNVAALLGTTTSPAGNFNVYQGDTTVNRWGGGHRDPMRTDATTTITFTSADYSINGTSTAVTAVSVPSATANPGLRLRYKKSGTGVNAHTLTSAAGNFDSTGATTLAVTVQDTVVEIQSDGTNWIVFRNSLI